MAQLVIGVGLGLAGLGAVAAIKRHNAKEREFCEENPYSKAHEIPAALGLLPVAVGALVVATSCFYSQDVGDTVVIRNPWQDVISYDTRNNLVNFYGDAEYSYDGGSAGGPDVSVNDRSGATADIDIQVNYSLDPTAATFLYSEYGTQENFTKNYVTNDLRSVAREVSGQFDTITMLTDRSRYTQAVQEKLSEKWEPIGLTVEQVSVQDVRYPDSITSKYAEAQAAEVARQQAENEQETAKVEAETKKVVAQGEADANAILTQSLTPEVIQQRYIDALKEIGQSGNLVVVPEGSTPVVSASK